MRKIMVAVYKQCSSCLYRRPCFQCCRLLDVFPKNQLIAIVVEYGEVAHKIFPCPQSPFLMLALSFLFPKLVNLFHKIKMLPVSMGFGKNVSLGC